VTTASTVPVTRDMSGDELDAEDAWHTVRRRGFGRLVVEAFARFRAGDGFSNSRALALQLALALAPFLIGLTGLAADLDVQRAARVLAQTVSELTPGGRSSDVLSAALSPGSAAERAGGISGDRPAVRKFARSAVLTLVVSVPVGLGFLLLVAGGPFGDAVTAVYGWSETTESVWDVVRWPVGLLVTTAAVTIILDHTPRRRQPSLSWLALGAGVAVVLTMVASGLLALYVNFSDSFGSVYGPLAGIIAMLLWCNLTSFALFFGTAMAAQLEALRAGVEDPKVDDPGPTTETRRTQPSGYGHTHD
jgi:uncharacterized BrkB/YihY/UPF0761 family membrane protein